MNWLPLQSISPHDLAQASVERILNALPAGLLIAIFAWGLLRILRRQNSGTRFAVWFLALLTVAALPALDSFSSHAFTGNTSLLAGMSGWSRMSWGSMRPAISIPAQWALLAFWVWAVGATFGMIRLISGLWRLRRLRLSCSPIVAADLDPVVRETLMAISASGSVTVAISEEVRVPAAIGFWKRMIVLPAWALRELPPEHLNVILLHEFAHLRRWDEWTNLVQKIVRALFFFHPAVWWIEKQLSVEREMACDDAVLAQTANPHGYATCLVSLLEKSLAHRLSQKQWSMVQAAVHRAQEASLRLAQILDKNRPVATRVWRPAVGIIATFSLVCLIALPHAPQLVGVDRGLAANPSNSAFGERAYSVATTQASFHPSASAAAVIPANYRTSVSSLNDESSASKSLEPKAGSRVRRAGEVHVVRTSLRDGEFSGPVFALTSALTLPWTSPMRAHDQVTRPEFRTVVFIQTAQFGIDDSDDEPSGMQVLRVQVWRVMLVGRGRELLAVPVVNSI
jgi:beta-lactamase regulating signal transducer with metallopeptidase domain